MRLVVTMQGEEGEPVRLRKSSIPKMENVYMKLQAENMLNLLSAFQSECRMAVLRDNGRITKEEQRCLKRIDAAVEKFSAEINAML